MFMSCNHSKKIAEEFAARQRAKELATKGHSKIAVAQTQKKKGPKTAVHNNAGKYDDESSTAPTENSGSRLGYTEKREMMKSQALDTVMTAIKEQEESLAKTNESIEMAYELARARLEVSHNKKSAILAMKKVKVLQPEYNHIKKRINGLKALISNLEDGYSKPENIKDDIQVIVTVKCNATIRRHTEEELLQELESGVLSESSGNISLESEDPIIGAIIQA